MFYFTTESDLKDFIKLYLQIKRHRSISNLDDRIRIEKLFVPAGGVVLVESMAELLSGRLKLLTKREAVQHHLNKKKNLLLGF